MTDYAGNIAAALGPDAWRLTPATFAHHLTDGRWHPARHLLYASKIIATQIARGNARIVVSMPPRHGKSLFASRWTSTWFLDKWPDRQIILASYGADLATKFSKDVRDDIDYYWKMGELNVQLHPTDRGADSWSTTEGGGLLSAGVAGPITGRGAHLLTIDDYLKNAKDAASPKTRQDQWEWLVSTAMTRLEPGASVIICATRWNLDDIIGRIKMMSDSEIRKYPWTFIVFPAVAEEEDVLGRKPGEVLWPERYDLDRLQEIQSDMGGEGAYFWECLFQQDPIPRSGGLVTDEMFPIVDIIPHHSFLRMYRAWDFAGSPEKGDFTVGVLMAEDTRTHLVYILDVVRGQWGAADLERVVYQVAVHDGPNVPIELEQEPGSAGKIAVEHYTSNVLRGFAATATRVSADKFLRAQPFHACAQMGHIRMLRGPWNKAYVAENKLFPDAANDDQVDASSSAYAKLFGKRYRGGVTWGRGRTAFPVPGMVEGQVIKDPASIALGKMLVARSKGSAALVTGATWGRRG